MKSRVNPLYLPHVSLGDMALLAGLIFFGPKLLELFKAAFPEKDPSTPVGIPGDGAEDKIVSSDTFFNFVGFSGIGGLFGILPKIYFPGDTINAKWTLAHLGPAGTYVAGIRITRTFSLGCALGIHNSDFYPDFIEQTFQVGNDSSYGTYEVSTTYRMASTVDPYKKDWNIYVRNTNGVVLFDWWQCANKLLII